MWRRALVLFLFLLSPAAAEQVEISEIMYDLEGTDKDREWLELHITEETNLSGWKFYEAETNHRLNFVQGSDLIPTGGYVVISRKSVNFLADNPGFSGTLFASSFSLSNTGESLEIRTPEKETVYLIEYSSNQGASGDGSSLQFYNGEWKGCSPTPGEDNYCPEPVEPEPEEPEDIVDEEIEEEEVEESPTNSEEILEEKVVYSQSSLFQEKEPEPVNTEKATSATIYSKKSGNVKVAIFFLLLISMTLNVIFVIFK